VAPLRRDAVIAALTKATLQRTSDEVVAVLAPAKVNVAKVNSVGQAAQDPQLEAIGGTVKVDRDGGPMRTVATPFVLGAAPMRLRKSPPGLGADTEAVLAQAGYSPADMERLRSTGALG
jgi:crotonobetainyl-CoA:carnitine CoA-transferase CaiB-like acyl-CoA transferase